MRLGDRLKKWVDMNLEELKQEKKFIKYLILNSLLSVLFFYVLTMCIYIVFDEFSVLCIFHTLLFVGTSILILILLNYLDIVILFKKLVKR